jgi:hypothetical protein
VPADGPHTLTVQLELTPLGRAIVQLAAVVASCDPATLPDSVVDAAYDVIAVQREHLPDTDARG